MPVSVTLCGDNPRGRRVTEKARPRSVARSGMRSLLADTVLMWASIVSHSMAARLVKTLPFDSSVHARAETADRLSVGRCGGDGGDTIGLSHRDPPSATDRSYVVGCWRSGTIGPGRECYMGLHSCACIREGGDSHVGRREGRL